jgi:ABC-type polar amino acid transport system ATPase subunit
MKLDIRHLTHTYDVDVINDLSLELEGYKSIALIGVSGSGKSTLLRILSGLEQATTGDVYINGKPVNDPEYRKSIGFVFQHHNLFPHLTLKRNISLVLEQTRGKSKEEAEAIALSQLAALRLEDQVDKLPKNVSGGQAQRGSLARALAMDPEIIFLDEPTSSLDPILTHEVLSAVEELRDSGKQFIFVTHVMNFVKEFADYVIFMELGNIVEQGPVSILHSPQTTSLKEFMKKVR